MTDFWGFLLQTLTASGAALLLLLIKAIFRDKLPPKWQFGIWGLLALVLLLPAGRTGRYILVNWPLVVESLKTALTGSYTLTRVVAPIPLPSWQLPTDLWGWLYAAYVLGVLVLLLHNLVTYVRLSRVIHRGSRLSAEDQARLEEVANRYGLKLCPARRVAGISSAFLFGAIHPVMVLPAEGPLEEKIVLHELLHRQSHDILWGLVIGLFRCLHWCNPLLWHCANAAGNDLEARCDQRVLERLEGEERRDYGRILLSMANDRYPCTPGTSSMANGGPQIRHRIEAIARFKRYPKGMTLVSACMAVILLNPLVLGTQAKNLEPMDHPAVAMAAARTLWCTTPAGALDTYAKALLSENHAYRAMCAPLSMQEQLADPQNRTWLAPVQPQINGEDAYWIYNFRPAEDGYRATLVLATQWYEHKDRVDIEAQEVQIREEQGRWVVLPQTDFVQLKSNNRDLWWYCEVLPGYRYAGETEDYGVEMIYQQIFHVDNRLEHPGSILLGPSFSFDSAPKPHARFDQVEIFHWGMVTCLKDNVPAVFGLSLTPWKAGEERPMPEVPDRLESSSSSSNGDLWLLRSLEPDQHTISINGGGSSRDYSEAMLRPHEAYAVDLYENNEQTAQLRLELEKGGPR